MSSTHITRHIRLACFFFFNDTATTEIYTLSLHDALPISKTSREKRSTQASRGTVFTVSRDAFVFTTSRDVVNTKASRSEEHTSELQSRLHLVCRLLLEKKKTLRYTITRCTSTTNSDNEAR